MGHSISVGCSNCSYKNTFEIGVGMRYGDLEEVLGWGTVENGKMRDEILEILKNHVVSDSEYGHAIYRCPGCNRLYGHFGVRLEYDGEKVYETAYYCSECKKKLELLQEEDLPRVTCPECKSICLRNNVEVFWD